MDTANQSKTMHYKSNPITSTVSAKEELRYKITKHLKNVMSIEERKAQSETLRQMLLKRIRELYPIYFDDISVRSGEDLPISSNNSNTTTTTPPVREHDSCLIICTYLPLYFEADVGIPLIKSLWAANKRSIKKPISTPKIVYTDANKRAANHNIVTMIPHIISPTPTSTSDMIFVEIKGDVENGKDDDYICSFSPKKNKFNIIELKDEIFERDVLQNRAMYFSQQTPLYLPKPSTLSGYNHPITCYRQQQHQRHSFGFCDISHLVDSAKVTNGLHETILSEGSNAIDIECSGSTTSSCDEAAVLQSHTHINEEESHHLPHLDILILCPSTALDATCARIGKGGGYYDKIIARVRMNKAIYDNGMSLSEWGTLNSGNIIKSFRTIGVGFDEQIILQCSDDRDWSSVSGSRTSTSLTTTSSTSSIITMDSHDQFMDEVISPVHWFVNFGNK